MSDRLFHLQTTCVNMLDMTSRERVLASLNHKEPDKVPIDLSGHRSSGMAANLYPKVREQLGLPPEPIRIYDIKQQLAVIGEDVLDRFGIDTIELGRGFSLDEESWADWQLPDGTACKVPVWSQPERVEDGWVLRSKTGRSIASMPDGALYFDQIYYPFYDGEENLEDLPAAMAESSWTGIAAPPGPVSVEVLQAGAKKLRQRTDRAIIGLFGGNLFECAQFLYRNDQALMMLAAEPERMCRFLDRLIEIHLANLDRFLSAVGEFIDIIAFGDDLGMQTGPQMSPQMYRDIFKPRHSFLWNKAKELADVKVMLHCCGGVRELLPDLIDAGLDAINPVQINCRGMDATELKAEFGKDLTFWGGGCDTGEVLPKGTAQEVADHVRKQVEIMAPGGGFVFQQVHNILADVPPENVVAMFNAVHS